jgi:hypothetical protein
VRGSEAPRRSTRGDQAAVCVHIDTQSSGFGSDEAHFALQTGVECCAADIARQGVVAPAAENLEFLT